MIYFFLFQYGMERFNAGIIVWIPLTAKWTQDFFTARAIFKCLARILTSRIPVKDDPLGIPDIWARVLCRFNRQFRRHRCAAGIPDNLSAAQIHDRSRTGPSFFLYMDVSDIRTPFLVNGFRPKITPQNIFLILRDAAMAGMMIVLFYYNRAENTTDTTQVCYVCWSRRISKAAKDL